MGVPGSCERGAAGAPALREAGRVCSWVYVHVHTQLAAVATSRFWVEQARGNRANANRVLLAKPGV